MALTDPDDIIERLTERDEVQISLKDVFDEDDLEKVIEDNLEGGSDEIKVRGSEGWFTTTKEKTKQTLKDNKDDLFNTDTIKDQVVNNSKDLIGKSISLRDLESNFNNITANIGDIGKVREIEIESAQANKQKELAKESPEQLTREQLLDLGVQGTSFKKSASRIGISESDFRGVLEREGFTITENNRIKK